MTDHPFEKLEPRGKPPAGLLWSFGRTEGWNEKLCDDPSMDRIAPLRICF